MAQEERSMPNQPVRCDKPLGKRVTIVGVGNIGSHAATLVARGDGVSQITLIDFDHYEPKNVRSQDITISDVGRPKVNVQTRRVKHVNPAIEVRTICARVQDVPLGLLRSDVILAGLDSRIARQWVNQAAWRLGVPWLDAAVDASGLLVRVNAYLPGQETCCCECAWDASDYAATALEQPYPCDAAGGGTTATNAPAALGAVTAGIMTLELEKLLRGNVDHALAGRGVMIDLRHHTHYVTTLTRNPQCRFDHLTWRIEKLAPPPSGLTLGQAIRLTTGSRAGKSDRVLGMEGHDWVQMQYCPNCGNHCRHAFHLADRIATKDRTCPTCQATMIVRGFDRVEWLAASSLDRRGRRRSLASAGFRPGDVLTIRDAEGDRHFELGGHRPASACPRRCNRPMALVAE